MGRVGRSVIGGGITVLLLFAGGITAVVGFFVMVDAHSKLDATDRTTGSVVDVYRGEDSDGFPTCSAAVAYQAGIMSMTQTLDYDCDLTLVTGDTVDLAYDPEHPGGNVHFADDVEGAPEQRDAGRVVGVVGSGILLVALVTMFTTLAWVTRAPDPSRPDPSRRPAPGV